jgi:hypothetical protein
MVIRVVICRLSIFLAGCSGASASPKLGRTRRVGWPMLVGKSAYRKRAALSYWHRSRSPRSFASPGFRFVPRYGHTSNVGLSWSVKTSGKPEDSTCRKYHNAVAVDSDFDTCVSRMYSELKRKRARPKLRAVPRGCQKPQQCVLAWLSGC